MKNLKEYIIVENNIPSIPYTIKEYMQNIEKYNKSIKTVEYDDVSKYEETDVVIYNTNLIDFCKKIMKKSSMLGTGRQMQFKDAILFSYKQNQSTLNENGKWIIHNDVIEMWIFVMPISNHKFTEKTKVDDRFYIFYDHVKHNNQSGGIDIPFKTYKDLMNTIIDSILNKMPNII